MRLPGRRRILAVRTKQSGASLAADSEVFLEGAPLNVCDLEVGPDGSLYVADYATGIIFRITYVGEE